MDKLEEHSPKQYLVGKKGQEQIRKGLSSGKLNEALNTFRLDNRLDLEDADALYWLVSKLKVKHSIFQHSVLQNFCSQIYEKIKAIYSDSNIVKSYHLVYDENNKPLNSGKTKILNYIDKLVVYGEAIEIQRLILKLSDLINAESIPQSVINALKSNEELYKECSPSLRNVMWKQDFNLLEAELNLLLSGYCSDPELAQLSREIVNQDVAKLTLIRREQRDLTKIVDIVRNDLYLYNKVIEVAEAMFKKTNKLELCLFRLDFIMAMHYHDLRKAAESDPVYSLAWAIDASISKQIIEPKRVRELERILEKSSTNTFVLRSLSLICNSPIVRHLLAQSCWHTITQSKAKLAIVGNTELWWLVELISFGANAPQMFDSNIFLISMLDNDIQSLCAEIYDFHDGNIGVGGFRYLNLLNSNEVARQLVYRTILNQLETKRLDEFEAFLPIMWKCCIKLCSKSPVNMSPSLFKTSVNTNSNIVQDEKGSSYDIRAMVGLTNADLRPGPANLNNMLKIGDRHPWTDSETKSVSAMYEYECFIQSLVTTIVKSKFLLTNLLNTTRNTTIFGFFEKFSHVNSYGHLQALRLIASLLSLLSSQLADKSSDHKHSSPNQGATNAMDVNINNLLSADIEMQNVQPDEDISIFDKQGSAYFLFNYTQKMAAYGCITPSSKKELRLAYEKLISSSSPLLFNYRISKSNSPLVSSLLSQLS